MPHRPLGPIIRARLEALLAERGWSRADLARALKINPAQVTRRLDGTKAIDVDDLDAFGRAFRIRFDVVELPANLPPLAELDEQRAALVHDLFAVLPSLSTTDVVFLRRALQLLALDAEPHPRRN